jgi:hypothetical protein
MWHTRCNTGRYTSTGTKSFLKSGTKLICAVSRRARPIDWLVHKGKIWFFDNYIIPLAKKLETCGVFGVSSDEYLSYALENRHEWELVVGEEIVQSMVEKCNSQTNEEQVTCPTVKHVAAEEA